jgi:hypothetical protein
LVAAYFRAERRGFMGGAPNADWQVGEAEVDALLERFRAGLGHGIRHADRDNPGG